MKVKHYNLVKNILISSLTAVQYYGYVVEAIPAKTKWIATFCIFALMIVLLRDADEHFRRKEKERNRTVVPEMKMSAPDRT